MLGLHLSSLVAPETHLNPAHVVWEDSHANRAKNVNVPLHHSSTETAEPSFGNRGFLGGRGELTDYLEPFAVQVCSLQAVRSPSLDQL
jgi:hypothetical protein